MPFYRLFYHIVWATKYREPLITSEFEADLHSIIASKAKDLGAIVHAVGGIEDHIHLVATVPPALALADFIGQVKGHSSHFVNHQCGLSYHFQWQNEYGVVSFGSKQLNHVVQYAHNQPQHHQNNSTIAYLEKMTDTD